ncbi:hypothetical protein [Niallia endozanthoxylica]|uniref:Uncharacterized protein n=1 Tax=Niallia endozanthoxylica TaxID=2036016 RepID=A0A5J5HU96_9BACI|nr:hypothetical protein [Niallia endozanthoxylica]KAA9023865.1 hypothetical protein F4V44_12050 [Niallia endozanthoxylica]
MNKDNHTPQEFQHDLKRDLTGKANRKDISNVAENDQQPDGAIIIGGGDPNLSPDAGKPLI